MSETSLPKRVLGLFERLGTLVWIPILVARVSEGYMFASSGMGKLGKLDEFIAKFVHLGIPAPSVQAPFVACLELVGGTCLVIGLGTRAFATLLAGTMAVAILTEHRATAAQGLDSLFYLSEWLLIVVLGWLVFTGAGKLSVDHYLAKRFTAED